MYKFKLADLSKGPQEGTVKNIYVQGGTMVHAGAPLFAINTSRGALDILAPVAGQIKTIFIKAGALVQGGTEILHIASEGPSHGAAPPPARPHMVAGNGVLATPYARKLAADQGVAISAVPGTGYNGRVLAKDILAFRKQPVVPRSSPPLALLKPFSKPVTPMRQAIARAMTNSWANVAYTNLAIEVNMTRLWDERRALVTKTEKKYGIKISFTALIALAAVKVLHDFPELNAKYDATQNVLKHDGVINLGLAVDTPKGLVVPVLQNAHTKNIVDMAQAIIDLAAKARSGKLTREDMTGGTFTLTNYGSVGAMFGVPVINYPEIAILGVGTIVDRVLGHPQGGFYNGKVMYLSLAADHRWIDGADIGRFLFQLKAQLEHPMLLLGGI